MQLTRSEAIDLAVRRMVRAAISPRPVLALCNAYNNVPEPVMTSIRAHFRAVCRQYEVVDDVRHPLWPDIPLVEAADATYTYDGHSLRI